MAIVIRRMIWMLPLMAWSGIVVSAPPAKALAEYREAASRFSSLVVEAEAGKKVSQLRSPEFEKLVEVLSDEKMMLASAATPEDDIEVDLEICGIANRVVMSLATFDLRENVAKAEDQREILSDFNAMMTRNILMFQDELKTLQPFLIRCLAKAVPGVNRFLTSLDPEQLTDVRRRGAVKMREGSLMTYRGAFAATNDTILAEDYRRAMLSVLAETAEAYASIMPLPERRKIAETAGSAALSGDDRYQAYLVSIERAFRSEECTTICKIE
ncbi:MAG: hypothetical protein ABL934_14570 [Lysobacteraceae bacterium]